VVGRVAQPRADRVPVTRLLQYFRAAPYTGPKGKSWGETRVAEAKRLLAHPAELATLFAESVAIVEAEYRNYQPFYPEYHRFGCAKGKEHGEPLRATVDVAARLSKREVWAVPDNPQLSFRYLDREIQIARSKPAPPELASGSTLLLDLFLANAQDRTPILCELKLRKDQCALYALIQVLTQAAYAATASQRERLVLFGSRPEFVLREALPNKPATLDLYILLVEKPEVAPYTDIHELAVELSKKLIVNSLVGRRIRRIAWIEARDDKQRGLTLTASQF
jgi:hypothetical protein